MISARIEVSIPGEAGPSRERSQRCTNLAILDAEVVKRTDDRRHNERF
jgi:hypothetical protein